MGGKLLGLGFGVEEKYKTPKRTFSLHLENLRKRRGTMSKAKNDLKQKTLHLQLFKRKANNSPPTEPADYKNPALRHLRGTP